jgi:hypothetical protein
METTLSTEQILEGNRMIAEFMGGRIQKNGNIARVESDGLEWSSHPSTLRYHSDWNKIMPVIKKINNWNIKDNPEVIVDNSVKAYLDVRRPLYKALHSIDILTTYESVVAILKWHDKQSITSTPINLK